MRLRVAISLLTLALPTAARAQAPGSSDIFETILQTYTVGGCGTPGLTAPADYPCVSGSLTFGLLRAGTPAGPTYGFRLDVVADFTGVPPSLPDFTNIRLNTLGSELVFSAVVPGGVCPSGSTLVEGRCRSSNSTFIGQILGSNNALGGRTITVDGSALSTNQLILLSRSGATDYRPERFLLEYTRFALGDFSSLYVTPTLTLTPEPATVALTAAGLAVLAAAVRRRPRA